MSRARLNEVLRWMIGVVLVLTGMVLSRKMRKKVAQHRLRQGRLHARYGLSPETPVLSHRDEPEVLGPKGKAVEDARVALTSGSTGSPKEVLYTPDRIRAVRRTFIDAFLRAYAALRPKRKSFYVFSSLSEDASLTSLMMEEKGDFPPYLSGLQAPYRVQAHPVFQELESSYGTSAVRVWVLALSNPGVIYSTNPSTIAHFIDALESDWGQCRELLRRELASPETLPPDLRRCRKRLESMGAQERIVSLASRETAPTLKELIPALELYACWDGGYVGVFLERIQAHFEGSGVRHLPMYSMSTEVVETLPVFEGERVVFLPVAPGVRSEFLPLGHEEVPSELLEAWDLEAGQEYTLVVSDSAGLRRYQTEDVFLCRATRASGELPDLRFQRRRGLNWSYTGEKLTDLQVAEATRKIAQQQPVLQQLDWIALAPTRHSDQKPPGYFLLLVGGIEEIPQDLGVHFDRILSGLNLEYCEKLQSGRLSPTQVEQVDLADYVRRVGGLRHQRSWESQFKFLPIVPREWERLDA